MKEESNSEISIFLYPTQKEGIPTTLLFLDRRTLFIVTMELFI